MTLRKTDFLLNPLFKPKLHICTAVHVFISILKDTSCKLQYAAIHSTNFIPQVGVCYLGNQHS